MSDKKESKKSTRMSKRFIIFFAIFAAVCLFVLFQAKNGSISLSRIIYMVGNGISGNAESTSIAFDSNDNNLFHLSRSGLFVLAPDGLRVYGISGEEKSFTPLAYRNPAVDGAGKNAVIFDRGGTSFLITNGKKVLFEGKAPAPIISMSINRSGAFSLVTDGPDCKNLVTVYNKNFDVAYKLYSTDEYVATAAVSADARKMATLSFTAEEGQFKGKIFFYNLNEDSPYSSTVLADVMPLTASFTDSENLTVICSDRFIRFDSDGTVKQEIPFRDGKLLFTGCESAKFSAFLLDRRITDNCYELVSSQRNVSEPSCIQFSEDVFSFSAAGNYLAVQFSDRVVVYKGNLNEVNTFSIPASTRSAIVREDGSVLIIGSNWANLLIP